MELAEAVIGKIEKSLSDPKVLDQILKQSVQDVESKFFASGLNATKADMCF